MRVYHGNNPHGTATRIRLGYSLHGVVLTTVRQHWINSLLSSRAQVHEQRSQDRPQHRCVLFGMAPDRILIQELPPGYATPVQSGAALQAPRRRCRPGGQSARCRTCDARLATTRGAGPLLETFTVNETSRQQTASGSRVGMFHYRDHQK